MSTQEARWCWRCRTSERTADPVCPNCGSMLHASPPPVGAAGGAPIEADEVLEIDISGMAPSERQEFLLFMDGSNIPHQVVGFLLIVAAKDEQRTRELLATVTEDDLVELDPEEVNENSEWARTVAAMLHPSGRMDAVVVVGPGRRIIGAIVSCSVWWVLVVVVVALVAVTDVNASFGLVVGICLLPLVCETWMVASRGSSPGKYLLNMRVSGIGGERPGLRSSVIRTVVLTWPFLLAFVGGPIGSAAFIFAFIWIVVVTISIVRDPAHRGIHDRVAGTRVVDGRFFPGGVSSGATG